MEEKSNETASFAVASAGSDDDERREQFRRRVHDVVARNAERSAEARNNGRSAEPGATEPAKRGRGRPKLPRDANGQIIRNTGQSSGATPDANASGNRIIGSQNTGTNPGGNPAENGATTQARPTVETEAIGVESPPYFPPPPIAEEPKPKRKYTKRGQSTGPIKAEHIKMLTVQIFALTAMMKNARHWKIQDESTEVDPWTPSAAQLINKYIPDDWGEKAVDTNNVLIVAFGLFGLVDRRIQLDHAYAQQLAMQSARGNREELLRQEGVSARPQPQPEPQPVTPVQQTQTHVKNSGATPTNPGKIAGLGGPM